MFARHFIDSLDFARNGRELHGEVPVTNMPRLQDMLVAPGGVFSYVVHGLQDKSGRPMLEVELEGSCQLRCQRCMAEFTYPVKLVSHLLLVSEAELDEFSDEDDDTDSIVASPRLDVLDMLEEEVLLSLPFAPMHAAGACQAATENLERKAGNPFAALAGLKKK